jgi:nitroreductase
MTQRVADHPIHELFLRRWSPRAMSGEALSREELFTLFEAARWAPSSGNSQPWRFVWALAGTPDFPRFFDLLAGGNQAWCARAGALVVATSRHQRSDRKPQRTHSFDTGAAWMSLALQGTVMGLVVHGMEGFDYSRAAEAIALPADHTVEAMIALGKPGRREELPEPHRGREAPNGREPATAWAYAGRFGTP